MYKKNKTEQNTWLKQDSVCIFHSQKSCYGMNIKGDS